MSVADLVITHPGGLLALAALTIPIIIHLFSRSRGRRVLVGNIALFRQPRRQRVNEFRLTQWLLLALRLAILSLAALILAGLATPGHDRIDGDVVYITPGWLMGASPEERAAISTKPAAFILAKGYPPWDGAGPGAETAPEPVLPLLAERLASTHHAGEVSVYFAGSGSELQAGAMRLPRDVNWHPLERSIAPAPLSLDVAVVFAPPRAADARVIAEGLKGLRRDRLPGLRWSIQPVSESGQPGEHSLSGKQVVVWLAAGRPRVEPGQLMVTDLGPDGSHGLFPLSTPGFPRLTLLVDRSRVTDVPADRLNRPFWRDLEGAASWRERAENGGVLREYQGALTPFSGEFLRHAEFPDLLLSVILGESGWRDSYAAAIAVPSGTTRLKPRADSQPRKSLQPFLAILLLALFLLERVLSERPRRVDATP